MYMKALGLLATTMAIFFASPAAAAEEIFEENQIVQIDDTNHNISEICNENGFDFKRYKVVTEDGYILSIDRIPPQGKKVTDDFEAPVILLQHGIEDSSIQWVINSPELAIAFVLSRAGYDVWLGNNRGNHNSQAHTTYSPKEEQFWEFDFEEMGLYDVPATINFILKTTEGKNKIGKLAAYIGHSEGTTQFFIGSSMKSDYYKQNVNLFVALAPVVRLENSPNKLMVYASQVYKIVEPLVKATGFYCLLDQNDVTKFLHSKFCSALPNFCVLMAEGFMDLNGDIDNVARFADKAGHNPAGAGWRNIAHYAQNIKNKRFMRWDFGEKKNMEKYGQKSPPDYDLSKIEVPIALAHGDVDQLADMKDVQWLLDEKQSGLQVSKLIKQLKQYHFGHCSFTMSKDITWFQNDIMPVIESQMKGV